MKPISATFFLVLSTLYVLQKQEVVTGHGDQMMINNMKLIEEACQHSPHKDLCISTLTNDPNSKGADLTGLAYIAIRVAAANASNIDEGLKSLMINSTTGLEPMIEQQLTDCIEYYSDAKEQLDSSDAAMSVKAYNDVEKWVKVALSDVDSCDELLSSQKTMMASENESFRQLCKNVLAIINVLNHK